ncbi:hypothetical protein B4113_1616 [Geobacillus sp. B4113_201601]|nr:hypothetical protein B4113_1616 [Geobacillus sp. B4113_201601]
MYACGGSFGAERQAGIASSGSGSRERKSNLSQKKRGYPDRFGTPFFYSTR